MKLTWAWRKSKISCQDPPKSEKFCCFSVFGRVELSQSLFKNLLGFLPLTTHQGLSSTRKLCARRKCHYMAWVFLKGYSLSSRFHRFSLQYWTSSLFMPRQALLIIASSTYPQKGIPNSISQLGNVSPSSFFADVTPKYFPIIPLGSCWPLPRYQSPP